MDPKSNAKLLALRAQCEEPEKTATQVLLDKARADISDLRNTADEYREELIRINRIAGGQGWTKPGEVTRAVTSLAARASRGVTEELRQQLDQAQEVETQLRTALGQAETKIGGFGKSVSELREKLDGAERDKRLLFEEVQKLKRQLTAASTELAQAKTAAPAQAAPSVESFEEERDALLHALQMEREDYAQLVVDVAAAARGAEGKALETTLPERNSGRSTKHFIAGLHLGAKSVAADVLEVLVNAPVKVGKEEEPA